MNMSVTIEMRLTSHDEDDLRAAEEVLTDRQYGLEVQRWPRARTLDPITIFGLVGGIVGLVDALLSLQDRWITQRRSATIRLRNEDGDEVELTAANRRVIEDFLEQSSSVELLPPAD
jgi:hypothetical protein